MELGVVELEDVARVSLGFKSLQNDFFYVTGDTVESYGIESRFLRPIVMMRDLRGERFVQSVQPRLRLFCCTEREPDLRGTGALKYIRSMARKPAAVTKQKRGGQTIREALEAQSGGQWYSPKAKPQGAHLWARKAYGSVFAPFVFKNPVVVDQRCNAVVPKAGSKWEELAALMCSSLFALALESQGSATLGAGALEVPTKALRALRVIDCSGLKTTDRRRLVTLGEAVWAEEKPIDWACGDEPGPAMHELDSWLLKQRGVDLTVDKLYGDLRATCSSRLRLASDKAVKLKGGSRRDIGEVARQIAEGIRPLIEGKTFPEAFVPPSTPTARIEIDRKSGIVVEAAQMFGNTQIAVRDASAERVFIAGDYPRAVSQVLVAALLLGRSTFQLPTDEGSAAQALDGLLAWRQEFTGRIEEECRRSSLGTRFEAEIRESVYLNLGVAPEIATEREFVGTFSLDSAMPLSQVRTKANRRSRSS